MFIKTLEKKGLERTLLLFKNWFTENYQFKGPIYKWKVFYERWDEESQVEKFRDFIFDQYSTYITARMLNKNSFKLVVDKKQYPRTFRTPSAAYLYAVEKFLEQQEVELIKEEKKDPEFYTKQQKRKKEEEEKKKLILAEKKKKKKEEKVAKMQAAIAARKEREQVSEITEKTSKKTE